MPQTLMAFLGMTMIMLFSLTYQRFAVNTVKQIFNDEFETIAAGVAQEALEIVAAKPFDESVRNGTVTPQNLNVSLLTPSPFPTGQCMALAACQDVDDVHGLAVNRNFQINGKTFVLRASFKVEYVDPANPEQVSSSPTFTKKVTVTVTHDRLIQPVVLSRLISYP